MLGKIGGNLFNSEGVTGVLRLQRADILANNLEWQSNLSRQFCLGEYFRLKDFLINGDRKIIKSN